MGFAVSSLFVKHRRFGNVTAVGKAIHGNPYFGALMRFAEYKS